jgi:hypothetical protein
VSVVVVVLTASGLLALTVSTDLASRVVLEIRGPFHTHTVLLNKSLQETSQTMRTIRNLPQITQIQAFRKLAQIKQILWKT